MENDRDRVDKKWLGVLLLALLACCLFLGLTFDALVEYQIIVFVLLLTICLFLIGKGIAAIRISNSIRQRPSKAIIIITASILIATSLLYYYHQGAFYGRKVIDATFLDDRSDMHLSLYSDGHYIVNVNWILGTEDFSGTYRISENSIILDEYSFNNKSLPKYLVQHGNKIYFSNDRQGLLRDTSFYYFKINRVIN